MKKDITISAIRMICTGSIVALHIFQQLGRIHPWGQVFADWLNLALVMFFSISAFLYSQRTITHPVKWFLKRYLEIVIPCVIVGGLTVLYYSFHKPVTVTHILATLRTCTGFQITTNNAWYFSQLWFLSYILFFYLTIPLIQKIPCSKCSELKFWTFLLGATALVQILTVGIRKLTGMTFMLTGIQLRAYLPYFVYKRYDIHGKRIKPIMYIATILSSILIPVICYLRYNQRFAFLGSITELLFIYIQTLAGFVLFYWIYRLLSRIKRDHLLLRLSDQISYETYLTHCLFIGYSSSMLHHFDPIWVGILLALLATFVSAIAVHYLALPVKKWLQSFFS